MKLARLRIIAAALASVAAAATACARPDAPTAALDAPAALPISPDSAQRLVGELVGGVLTRPNLGLLSCSTPSYGSVTKTVGRSGGTILIGPHALVIPEGALASNVAITATAPKGSRVEVRFEPHGLTFARSAALSLSYRHCLLSPLLPRVVYIDGQARILELVPSVGSLFTKQVVGKIDHFSGYAVAD
ncbi:MAG TPA: hypothetical protein VEA99_11355 [Gemmatimonadaceae bacterium]|nr:hypothetical protein [Gemmatimonadaceae bacterium]